MIKALTALGLRKIEAELYIFLTKNRMQKIEDLGQIFNSEKNIIKIYLLNLENLGLVFEDNSGISAIPFEEALELLINSNKRQTEDMETKKELLIDLKEFLG